jgi:hypothetical protein
MSSAPIAHSQNRDTTPPVPARVAALRFVLDCHAKKKAAYAGRLDDAKEIKNDSRHHYRSTRARHSSFGA